MSGAKIDRANIYRLLQKHRRPLSARRLMILAQEEFAFEGNYGLLLSTLKTWAKQGKSVVLFEDGQANQQTYELIEVRHGIFKLRISQSIDSSHESEVLTHSRQLADKKTLKDHL